MISYVILFLFLWVCAFYEYIGEKFKTSWVPFAVVGIFLSLRMDTGNDWPTYKGLFEYVPNVIDSSLNEILQASNQFGKEVLFVFYNITLKTIFPNFQILLAATSCLVIWVQYQFLKRRSVAPITVLAASISWLLFSLYMSAISQAMALSFFLLFVMLEKRRKYISAAVLGVLSLFFQVSALMYFLFYLLAALRYSHKIVLALWCLAIVSLASGAGLGFDPAAYVIEFFIRNSPGFIQNKLTYYYLDRGLVSSLLDRIFVTGFTVVFGAWLIFDRKNIIRFSERWICNISIYFVLFQAFFMDYAVFRYRMLYFVFPLIFLLAANRYYKFNSLVKFSGLVALVLVSSLYFFSFLSRPASTNYVPYQNVVYSWITGDPGDGEIRYLDMLRQIIRN